MKAIVYEKYGSPDVLREKEVAKPKPGDNEVLISVRATEVTKSDCEMRSFHFQVNWFWLPLRMLFGLFKPRKQVLGSYFSGEIVDVGKNVTRLKEGDHVFGCAGMRLGAYAEYLCLPDDYALVAKPRNLSFVEAAAVPLGALNALHFITTARIQKGERVLINGAGGSIGIFAVQIAKTMGAEVTVVDAGHKEILLRRLGADHFIDYAKRDFTQSGCYYDVILSVVVNTRYSACIRALKPNGRYLMANPRLLDMLRSKLTTRFTRKSAITMFAAEKQAALLVLVEMLEQEKIRAVVDKVYAFAQAAEAHRRVESEERLGAIVLAV